MIRKLGLAAIAAIVAMGLAASSAMAAPISASGYIDFSGNVVTSRCDVTLVGDLTGTAVRVTGGSATNCTIGTLALSGFDWTGTLDTSSVLNGVVAALTAPIVGTCSYAGSLTGSYDGRTVTITGNTLSKTGGGLLCTSSPSTRGVLVVN